LEKDFNLSEVIFVSLPSLRQHDHRKKTDRCKVFVFVHFLAALSHRCKLKENPTKFAVDKEQPLKRSLLISGDINWYGFLLRPGLFVPLAAAPLPGACGGPLRPQIFSNALFYIPSSFWGLSASAASY